MVLSTVKFKKGTQIINLQVSTTDTFQEWELALRANGNFGAALQVSSFALDIDTWAVTDKKKAHEVLNIYPGCTIVVTERAGDARCYSHTPKNQERRGNRPEEEAKGKG